MDIAIKGNKKMGSEVYLFNLPAKETCTPSAWCLFGKDGKPACYALRNNFRLPSVVESAKKRLEMSKKESFTQEMIAFIQKKRPKYFRIHSSGDFYSQTYVEKWIEIAKACPETKFRGSTRRQDLLNIIEELNALPNVIIRESLDSFTPKRFTSLHFAALSKLEVVDEEGAYKCLNDCPKCGYYCWEEECNITFDEH